MANSERCPKRIRRYNARPFFLTLLVVCVIVAFSLASGRHNGERSEQQSLVKRHLEDSFESKDCHLVHGAADKCAFVRSNCPDEEAGLLSYLELYYCQLPKAQPFAFTIITLWVCMLFSTIGIAASDFFCVNLSTMAAMLGMSESLAGVTFLAFGNGSPDVFSTFAAMSTNSGSLAIGELIGAAGFITAVVAGSMALVRPFKVAKKSFVRDICFFIVAAAMALALMLDGKLTLWESLSMVLFYVFYVIFVLGWHWSLDKKRLRRQTEALVRNQFSAPGTDVEAIEPYHDDEDLPAARPPQSRATTTEDLATLERRNADWSDQINPDDVEADRERWLGEISSNMRVSRPRAGERRLTNRNPIRPSLVGALEFQAVIAGLQKSSNLQTMPIDLRGYSDDATFAAVQQRDNVSTMSDPPGRSAYDVAAEYGAANRASRQYVDARASPPNRTRAASANAADMLRVDSHALGLDGAPRIDLLGPPDEDEDSSRPSEPVGVSVTQPSSPVGSRASSTSPSKRSDAVSKLLTPELYIPRTASGVSSEAVSPTLTAREGAQALPRLSIPAATSNTSSPISPFPTYSDDPFLTAHVLGRSRAPSIRLPAPGMSRGSLDLGMHLAPYEQQPKPRAWWWPYHILPPPEVIYFTLFPTLADWGQKSVWARAVAVAAVPSVFLLTITLPVVESEDRVEEDEQHHIPTLSLPHSASLHGRHSMHPHKSSITILEPESPTLSDPSQNPDADGDDALGDPATAMKGLGGHGNVAKIATSAQYHHNRTYHPNILNERQPLLSPSQPHQLASPEQLPSIGRTSSCLDEQPQKDWNRWLLLIQCFTSPTFTTLIIYANFFSDTHGPRMLVKMLLYSLFASLIFLAIVLTTSTPERAPKWRRFLCFAGFVVSISWISTVANEVVGVLKWLGVVLNISDAILGLTVFAVGNSLGDLVADITVARIGYPVMALSACFGGPMLNILLGIGLSGLYMTVRGARRSQQRHPGHPVKFKPFRVDVSGTLWISGLSLLVTLVALLVAVPARRWRMDRVVGWGLVVLWGLSTTANLVVEALGLAVEAISDEA